jgi:precorrin-6B methylase 2
MLDDVMTGARNVRLISFAALLLWSTVPIAAQFPDEGREKHEKVAEVIAALQPTPGHRIADVGAGDGFYSVRIARAVGPSGRVMAVDVSQSALDKLRARVTRDGVTNLEVTLGSADSPRLASDAYDAALIYNSYHEMIEHAAMLRGILTGLKPGGRLVIIEPIHDSLRAADRAAQTAKHEISDEITAAELRAAGFQIERQDPAFRPFTDPAGPGGWWLIVAVKPVR